MTFEILHGDCIEVMKTLPPESVDAVVTDPPYGIRFMGKAWDGEDIEAQINRRMSYKQPKSKNGKDRVIPRQGRAEAAGTYDTSLTGNQAFQAWTQLWAAQALRVLKPGGHLLSFAAPRTYHRMTSGIEDAGFEIRDQIMWIFGSGFPKSHNIEEGDFAGWGTALKPAHEPIVLARKPLVDSVARNAARYGTGALNISDCRIGDEKKNNPEAGFIRRGRTDEEIFFGTDANKPGGTRPVEGRWPANVMHDGSDEVLDAFPDAPGQQGALTGNEPSPAFSGRVYKDMGRSRASTPRGDEGSAARFFYCPKTSKRDRDEGVSDPEKEFVQYQTANGTSGKASSLSEGRATAYRNTHPTVKPTELMRYLCRLVTPQGGVVLDPFMGSGSTGKAAMLEKFRFIGIEKAEEYLPIARQRIEFAAGHIFGGPA